MRDIRSWSLFGGKAPSARAPRTSTYVSHDKTSAPATSSAIATDLEPSDQDRLIGGQLAEFPEPTLVLDLDGGLIAGNDAAHALGRRVGAPLDDVAAARRLLARIQLANGGGSQPWIAVPGAVAIDAMVAAPELTTAEDIFELRSTPLNDADGQPGGWVVRLMDITSLIAALRGRRAAEGHREQLLKLLSHDMRTPLAAILTTLAHPDLAAMPSNLKQIIEGAARRALQMVDSNARLIRAQSSDYNLTELNFRHVLEEVIDASWSLSKEANIKLILEPTDTEPLILADRGPLTQALMDVIQKLIAEAASGDRLLCSFEQGMLLDRRAVTLKIEEAAADDLVRNGTVRPGGPDAMAGVATSQVDDGDSLDFFKTIIARHSGTTMCESEPGVGRSITITIPIVDPNAERV